MSAATTSGYTSDEAGLKDLVDKRSVKNDEIADGEVQLASFKFVIENAIIAS